MRLSSLSKSEHKGAHYVASRSLPFSPLGPFHQLPRLPLPAFSIPSFSPRESSGPCNPCICTIECRIETIENIFQFFLSSQTVTHVNCLRETQSQSISSSLPFNLKYFLNSPFTVSSFHLFCLTSNPITCSLPIFFTESPSSP